MALLATLLLSVMGTIIAIYINIPLPFLLGPLIILTASSIFRIKITSIASLHKPVFFLLGIYLGATLFKSSQLISFEIMNSLLLMLIFNILAVFIGSWYFIKFAKYTKTEAVFTALPGLLAYIASYLVEYKIPFEKVVIPHAIRVIVVVTMMPFLYSVIANRQVSSSIDVIDFTIPQLEVLHSLVIISICAIPILIIFKKLRIVNFYFLAGMITATLMYYLGFVSAELPNSGLQIILVFIGIMIGTRLSKVPYKQLIKYSGIGIISTILLIIVTVVCAYFSSILLDKSFLSIFLSFAPGGVHEMVLIALIYGIEPLFVTIHHLVRIIAISFFLPFISKITK